MNNTVPSFPTDWVDVANDLLSKCHINLRLRKLTDCDANVFIGLYENILGEKVPGKTEQNIDLPKVKCNCLVGNHIHKKPIVCIV